MQTNNRVKKNQLHWSAVFIGGVAIISLLVIKNIVMTAVNVAELQKEYSQIPIPPNSELLYKEFHGCPESGSSRVTALYLSGLSAPEIASYFANSLVSTKWDYSAAVASPIESPVHWSSDGYWPTDVPWPDANHLGIDIWTTKDYIIAPNSPLKRYPIDSRPTMFYVIISKIDDQMAYNTWQQTVTFDNWDGNCRGSWTL